MNMGFGLYQEQTLKLVMTPELRQAITILQYSATDLLSYLQEQAAENPVIELHEVSATAERLEQKRPTERVEIDWKEIAQNQDRSDYSVNKNESTYNPLDYVQASDKTLYDYLTSQLGFTKGLTSSQKQMGLFLIGNINEKGYLEVSLEEASQRLGVSILELEPVLTIIQRFDPVGVGARNLEECLVLQLQYEGYNDEHTIAVVLDHLQDLANNRFSRIAEKLQITVQQVQEIADVVKTLNPRPGAAYGAGETRYIVPDVAVEKISGEYVVFVNDVSTPRLSINRFYEKMLKENKTQEEAKQFIHDKLNAAIWLAKSLEQRRLTLLKVTQAIVEMQREFFDRGVHYLKPMTQKEIAEKVNLHESTVSRATSNKYVQTPRGVFELKYFFTSALTTASGESASSESVKKRIKALIDAEDRKQPLSDQKLSELLDKEGIEISRRTVAKYREEMMIASSAKRKRY
ncbi:RNA polymerase factor sigma-54 [Brevibacillus sp. SYSU BS000544]|uniref:RNA polymerase factor sigma-54 n=1 Tax=Brevibacillus sp. SYSU BS000544 TaxID=3416443 RepID=UPI003CE5C414